MCAPVVVVNSCMARSISWLMQGRNDNSFMPWIHDLSRIGSGLSQNLLSGLHDVILLIFQTDPEWQPHETVTGGVGV